MFLVFYICRLLLLPHGVSIFGTNLHRVENFGLWRQCHPPDRLWKKGTYQNLSLERNCALFVGCILSLNEVALSMLSRICSVERPYSISVLKKKKSCVDLKFGAVMAQRREKVTWPKKAGKLGVSFRIIWHYGGSGSIGLWRQKCGIDTNKS